MIMGSYIPMVISKKMNVIAKLKFELANYNITVQQINNDATWTPSLNKKNDRVSFQQLTKFVLWIFDDQNKNIYIIVERDISPNIR